MEPSAREAVPPALLPIAAPVRVAQVAAEHLTDEPPEIPWEMTPAPGAVALQLRSTVRRVAMGAGLARRTELVERVRALPGVPSVVTSPAGGTLVVGGDAWLGLCAIGVPAAGQPLPLDWMLRSLHRWFQAALAPLGVTCGVGRVEGAWCPGFSDITVAGRKLAGIGFRTTRDHVVARGLLAVQPLGAADEDLLVRTHALIGLVVRPGTSISLSEATGTHLDVAEVIRRWRGIRTGGA